MHCRSLFSLSLFPLYISLSSQQIIKECKRKKKAGHIAYGSLSQAIGTRLRLAVGDEHWKMACQIHKRLETGHANLQKTKGYKKGQKLNVAPAASKNAKDQKSKGEQDGGENATSKKVDDSGNKRVSFSEGVQVLKRSHLPSQRKKKKMSLHK